MTTNLRTLNNPSNNLGEGLFINEEISCFYWVDIIERKIFEYNTLADTLRSFSVDNIPSKIFRANNHKITYLANNGLCILNTYTKKIRKLIDFKNIIGNEFRTNDGVFFDNENFMFSSIHNKTPENQIGVVYLYQSQRVTEVANFHIPNSFIKVGNYILISDSLTKAIYKFEINNWKNVSIWADLSNLDITPDGGCIGKDKYIYITFWGDGAIGKFNNEGRLIKKINVPALQPTSCECFNNSLVVTTARLGLNNNLQKNNHLSGQTIILENIF